MSVVLPPDDPARETAADLDLEISPDAAHELHRAALQLKRSEVVGMLAAAAVLALAAAGSIYVGAFVHLTFFAVAAAVIVAKLALELVRLKRDTPMESWRRERREMVEDASGRAEHLRRSAGVVPIATFSLMAVTCAVTGVQLLVVGVRESIPLAALVKPAVRAGEWWRLLSAAFLHGNLLHLLANMGALSTLGGIVETYDRPTRIPLAYLAAVLTGSIASTLASGIASVGASGGVLGIAGFLVVSSRLRRDGAPAWVRKQVWSMIGATAVLGIVAFFFIDNAAHLGGALAGAAVGWLSASAAASKPLARALDAAGWLSAAILTAAAVFTATRLVQ